MALYDYPRDKHPNAQLPRYLRRPFDSTDTTTAMHWDGTYRDRVRLGKGEFWTEEDYNSGDRPWGIEHLAKHLAK